MADLPFPVIPRGLITVLMIGQPDPGYAARVRLTPAPAGWADGFTIVAVPSDEGLPALLAQLRPQLLLTFGTREAHPQVLALPPSWRSRWHHEARPEAPPAMVAMALLARYLDAVTGERLPTAPLVSVFTCAYRRPDWLDRLYASLCRQTYGNWEWVVYDDSPDDTVFRHLRALREREPRLLVARTGEPCGVIGEVKRRACGLASGDILVEADHDDELVETCLADVVEGFATFPEAGFVYSDNAALGPDGRCVTYGGPDGYAFGHGSYREETWGGRTWEVTNAPPINALTVRHIVGMPDHVRAWTRAAYHAAGGHHGLLHVADDYDLCVRTFLTTRMVHVQRFTYVQHHHAGAANSHMVRNAEIQRLVALLAQRYEARIHARLEALGVPDFLWHAGQLDWSRPAPAGAPAANLVLGPRPAAP
jgi:hypothetical protein